MEVGDDLLVQRVDVRCDPLEVLDVRRTGLVGLAGMGQLGNLESMRKIGQFWPPAWERGGGSKVHPRDRRGIWRARFAIRSCRGKLAFRPSSGALDIGGSAMNVANLQLEGLMMALASVNNLLVRKGLISIEEIDDALHRAESAFASEQRLLDDMSPSQRDAVCFPLRLLRMANKGEAEDGIPNFPDLAKMVARGKVPYNDQM